MPKTRGMLEALRREATGMRPVAASSPKVEPVESGEPAPVRGRRRDGKASGSSNPSREGRVNVTGYFDPAVKQSIRLIQAQFPTRRTEQELLAEALNDLFAKYKVPETAK